MALWKFNPVRLNDSKINMGCGEGSCRRWCFQNKKNYCYHDVKNKVFVIVYWLMTYWNYFFFFIISSSLRGSVSPSPTLGRGEHFYLKKTKTIAIKRFLAHLAVAFLLFYLLVLLQSDLRIFKSILNIWAHLLIPLYQQTAWANGQKSTSFLGLLPPHLHLKPRWR